MKRITLAWEQKIVGCAPMLPLPLLCIYICAYFFWYFFIYFQRFSFDFQPNLPTFIFICYRFNTNPLLFLFFYIHTAFRWFSCMLNAFACHTATVSTQHTSRIESHWLSQCKANIHLFKNEFIHILYLIMLDRFIYTIFWFCFIFVVLGIFLGSADEGFSVFILPSSALFSCFRQI